MGQYSLESPLNTGPGVQIGPGLQVSLFWGRYFAYVIVAFARWRVFFHIHNLFLYISFRDCSFQWCEKSFSLGLTSHKVEFECFVPYTTL